VPNFIVVCVRKVTTALLRVSLVNNSYSWSCVMSDSFAVLDATLSFGMEWLSMMSSGKTDSVW
jgi:hypothetical protein